MIGATDCQRNTKPSACRWGADLDISLLLDFEMHIPKAGNEVIATNDPMQLELEGWSKMGEAVSDVMQTYSWTTWLMKSSSWLILA